MKLNILCIGDIVGRPGRRIVAEKLKGVVSELDIDCVIANAENAAGGSGDLTVRSQNLILLTKGTCGQGAWMVPASSGVIRDGQAPPEAAVQTGAPQTTAGPAGP